MQQNRSNCNKNSTHESKQYLGKRRQLYGNGNITYIKSDTSQGLAILGEQFQMPSLDLTKGTPTAHSMQDFKTTQIRTTP
jgi:hypothetical protein